MSGSVRYIFFGGSVNSIRRQDIGAEERMDGCQPNPTPVRRTELVELASYLAAGRGSKFSAFLLVPSERLAA